MNDHPILVTAAIIQKEDKILIAQRLSSSSIEPDKWEFPGGKIHYLEEPKTCLKREIKEELNIDIDVVDIYDVIAHVYSLSSNDKMHVIILFYNAKYISGTLMLNECQDAKWVSHDMLQSYEFVAADVPVRDRLLHHSNP
jgi:8-oxo-dGTP diphosphatase